MKKTLLLSIALSSAVALAGTAWAAERGRDGELRLLYWQAPSTMMPYLSGGTKELEASSLVIEPLARYDPDGKMHPWLAEEIPTVANGGISEDLTSITWKLRRGIKWSDGSELTSADAVFTYEYCSDPDTGCTSSNYFNDIVSVDALDSHTIQINFTVAKPFPYAPFVGYNAPIMQAAQF